MDHILRRQHTQQRTPSPKTAPAEITRAIEVPKKPESAAAPQEPQPRPPTPMPGSGILPP